MLENIFSLSKNIRGSGCDTVGRVVASKTRGQQFEPHHHNFFYNWTKEKTKIKEKETENGTSSNKEAIII